MSDAPVTAPNSPRSAPLVENPSETPDTGVRESMPRRFGKYTLIRKLAMGGMAELFLALQLLVELDDDVSKAAGLRLVLRIRQELNRVVDEFCENLDLLRREADEVDGHCSLV